jgi:hypothetical protein
MALSPVGGRQMEFAVHPPWTKHNPAFGSIGGTRPARSFRDDPKDQTSDAQLRIEESRHSGFDAEPITGPRLRGPAGIAPE